MTTPEPTNRGAESAARYSPVIGQDADAFGGNLLLILALGVAFSAWILYFTDWFEPFGTVLALGGIFSWLAFVSKILGEDRLKSLQASADRRLFSNPRWRKPLAFAAVAGLVAAQFYGSIEVSSTGSVDRAIWVNQDPANLQDLPDRVSATRMVRSVYATNWMRPRHVRVKVSGYPTVVVAVRPWQRIDLRAPGSFISTPVLLLRPTPALIRNLSKGWRIRVTVNGQPQPDEPLENGRTAWVGCDEDVEVPQRLVDMWAATASAQSLALWKEPRALGNGKITLKPFSSVDVAVLNENNAVYWRVPTPINVRAPARIEDFPQVEDLDVPSQQTS